MVKRRTRSKRRENLKLTEYLRNIKRKENRKVARFQKIFLNEREKCRIISNWKSCVAANSYILAGRFKIGEKVPRI